MSGFEYDQPLADSSKRKRLYEAEPLQFKPYPYDEEPIVFSEWESQDCEIMAMGDIEESDEWLKYYGEPMTVLR